MSEVPTVKVEGLCCDLFIIAFHPKLLKPLRLKLGSRRSC